MNLSPPPRPGSSSATAGAAMILGSLVSIQVGLALSIGFVGVLGTSGAGWIRLAWAGALMLLVLARPSRVRFTWRSAGMCAVLGVVTVGNTFAIQAALALVPMGTASALNFLGPLFLAAITGRPRRLRWPGLALVGVLLLTEPWSANVSARGVVLSLSSGALWALYIVLTQRVGDEVSGIDGLALSVLVAGVVSTCLVGPGVIPRLTPALVIGGLGIAVLCPLVPYLLEFLALRRIQTAAFGTLMALEPAVAAICALVLLGQLPRLTGVLGIGLVVVAGVGAARGGSRETDVAPQPRSG